MHKKVATKATTTITRIGCGCGSILLVNLTLGGVSFWYCLKEIAGMAIPWYGNAIIGLFTGQITVPLAIVLWLLSLFGIHGPFIHV